MVGERKDIMQMHEKEEKYKNGQKELKKYGRDMYCL